MSSLRLARLACAGQGRLPQIIYWVRVRRWETNAEQTITKCLRQGLSVLSYGCDNFSSNSPQLSFLVPCVQPCIQNILYAYVQMATGVFFFYQNDYHLGNVYKFTHTLYTSKPTTLIYPPKLIKLRVEAEMDKNRASCIRTPSRTFWSSSACPTHRSVSVKKPILSKHHWAGRKTSSSTQGEIFSQSNMGQDLNPRNVFIQLLIPKLQPAD